MVTINLGDAQPRAAETVAKPARFAIWMSLVAWISLWHRRRRTRGQLATLPPHLLADVGLTHEQAALEVRRSRLLVIDGPMFPPM